MDDKKDVCVVILAAGKGTRLECTDIPKVMCPIGGKPIVSYIVDTLKRMGFDSHQIMMVVGYEKQKVKECFGDSVLYADQDEQLGTAHATSIGLEAFNIQNSKFEILLVIGGDDSAFYSDDTIQYFIDTHRASRATVSLLTVHRNDPSDLGRIIRNEQGMLMAVKEKEELSEDEKKIQEVSTGMYCFDPEWFASAYARIPKVDGLGEYGLPATVALALKERRRAHAVQMKDANEWFGINTKEELALADTRKKDIS
jgi:bifunctional N-acetylglucosamine-1-phosphate-uridyltransferase/glucosamine-1-phosphate-acetyltransferase GlmU-like protein